MSKKKVNESEELISSGSSTVSTRDELATLISKNLSKTFKDQEQTVWYLDGPEDSPSDILDWISTGSSLLDLAISNRPYGGVPVGRITEITGLEGSGKSLVAAHLLAETQKKGGVSVFIDTEAAVSRDFMTAIGVDLTKMMYLPMETIEDIFQAIENIINTVRNNEKSKLITIVVDSLAGASTKIEMDADYDKDGYATTKAILLSKAMRKITNLIAKEKICLVFTNQLRTKMNAMAFADPWCVNPYTTKIKIRKMNYIEEEITLAELAERFLNLNDFNTENAYDMSDLNIEVLSKNLKSGKDEYKKINTFLVKETVPFYYSDDKLEGTAKHRIIENGKEVFLENHSDFKKIENEMKVVDIEVEDNENYYANDRLNHNTTSGGKAVAFHSSVRVRLNNAGALKKKDFGGVDQIVGNKLQAKVIKNRLGPPQRKASFEIFYDSGIDNYSGWVAVLKTYKFLAQGGAYNKYKLYDTNGNELEEIQFKTAEIPELFSKRPEIQQAMYKNLCDIMIMKYENNGQIKMNDDIQIANDEDGGIE